jgi:hypothetical protein
VRKALTIIALTATIGGCADLVKRKQALEQEAVSTAITLCKKFGHQQDTPAFTRCAEQRFDEYMVNHR